MILKGTCYFNLIISSLNYFGEKRLLVGKIRFSADKESLDKKRNDKPKVVPIFLCENALKNLNKTFMH